jgi:hypothetical protein
MQKKAATIYPEENPLASFLQQSGANEKTNTNIFTNGDYYSDGFTFKPLKKGVIKALVINIPKADPNLVVKIWDSTAGTEVLSEVVNVATDNFTITKAITPLAVEANKTYLIIMKTTSEYDRYRNNPVVLNMPCTCGNILITQCFTKSNSTNFQDIIPSISKNDYYGDISFIFQQQD